MDTTKQHRLQAAGWRLGDANEFLGLTPAEAGLVEMRWQLAAIVRETRARQHLTQAGLAQLLGSSQSRVAKLEAGDPAVSLDLMVRALLALGLDVRGIGERLAR